MKKLFRTLPLILIAILSLLSACQKETSTTSEKEVFSIAKDKLATPLFQEKTPLAESNPQELPQNDEISARGGKESDYSWEDSPIYDAYSWCNTGNISCGQTISSSTTSGATAMNNYVTSLRAIAPPYVLYHYYGNYYAPEKTYTLTVPSGKTATVRMTPSSADLDLFVIEDCASRRVANPGGYNSYMSRNPSGSETVTISTPGTYIISVDGYKGAKGNFSLSVSCSGGSDGGGSSGGGSSCNCSITKSYGGCCGIYTFYLSGASYWAVTYAHDTSYNILTQGARNSWSLQFEYSDIGKRYIIWAYKNGKWYGHKVYVNSNLTVTSY